VEALQRLVANLPRDLPATVLVVVHMSADAPSYLPEILRRAGPLPAVTAEDGLQLEKGHIIVARPGFHLLVRDGHVHLGTGPKENRSKPGIDPLFRSVAATYGGRAIGVILSGWLNDGTSGLYAIKRCGGLAVVQDPLDALAPEMPKSAIANVDVDHVVPIAGVGDLLGRLTREPADPDPGVPPEIGVEAQIAMRGGQSIDQTTHLGQPSIMTCADCGGMLTELKEGALLRYRCHVGHAYTAEALLAEQGEAIERALLSAMKTLEERAAMWTRMADRSERKDNRRSALLMQEKARIAKTEADLIRTLLDSRRERATTDAPTASA
jgi:two-component system chemotaxis response regulator CheB